MFYFSRWKSALIWLSVVLSVWLAAPNFLPQTALDSLPSWIPKNSMTLGLDLQGGSHIMLKLERNDIIQERRETILDEIRANLRKAGIGYTGLAGTGQKITFKLRDPNQIEAARTALKDLREPVSTGLTGTSVTELSETSRPDGSFQYDLTDAGIDYRVRSAVAQSIEVVRRRVDELGTTEPLIQGQGTDRIIVQVPGLQDPQRLKAILNKTAKLTFHLVDQTMSAQEALATRPPANSEVLYTNDNPPVPMLIQKRALLTGENLVDAQPGFDQQRGNQPIVSFRFDSQGAQIFGRVTQENVGRPFAVVLDNKIITAPNINEPILGGSGQISGNFNVQSANDLAVLLRAGALPATLTVVEERTVGPGLGADSIRAGVTAAIISFIAVVSFMVYFYGTLGLIANFAMMVNIVMIVAVLSALGATLTLPGIAGIVLTIGQAVDSNVLFYERFREEMKQGRSIVNAMESGFQKAFGTIVDANLTTLIAAVILFYMGSGPVRGFAVTLSIGILTTVFTAYTISRLMISYWLRRNRSKGMPKGIRTHFFDFARINFMRIRNWSFAITAALTVASVVGFATLGLNLGIDFTGGSLIELKARQGDADLADIRSKLSGLDLGSTQVQGFGDPTNVMVRVQSQKDETAEQGVISKVRGVLEKDYDFRRVEVVGPSVSGELAMTGLIGIGLSLIAIMAYIWIRFEWQFAIGALTATLHDAIMTLGLYVYTRMEFDITAIAALLTIIGFSLNDTVVIYDRMRENLRRFKKMPLEELIDLSLNSTLSRTILTAGTTFIAILGLVVFGGEVIRSFTISMLFGVFVGTYSSIYVAGPMLIYFKLRPDAFDKDKDSAKPGDAQAPTPAV
ncbi:MAG: protein translocase subunit SecDF [Rhizobiaceae bacterium]|nr:protein translocase subunit SecDF [Rhizobiaceae bacterium]